MHPQGRTPRTFSLTVEKRLLLLRVQFWFPGRKKHQEEGKKSPTAPQTFVSRPHVAAGEAGNVLSLLAGAQPVKGMEGHGAAYQEEGLAIWSVTSLPKTQWPERSQDPCSVQHLLCSQPLSWKGLTMGNAPGLPTTLCGKSCCRRTTLGSGGVEASAQEFAPQTPSCRAAQEPRPALAPPAFPAAPAAPRSGTWWWRRCARADLMAGDGASVDGVLAAEPEALRNRSWRHTITGKEEAMGDGQVSDLKPFSVKDEVALTRKRENTDQMNLENLKKQKVKEPNQKNQGRCGKDQQCLKEESTFSISKDTSMRDPRSPGRDGTRVPCIGNVES
ncbi:hypothetical protein J1605_013924 [Eschrichtius robustus]|uniref:Uncharacterized protein n=1 Tax=Eschrichtius robustus TaxID=9764 RepID=A0AB34GEF7_ESCRO|nr:hypothetical protein J1605_013924 [Eschrichtius robustus]